MRILAGRWKGRALEVPEAARPTSGRARQALFDLLGERVAGARVLDLYAGSGALGLEALSRGAAACTLVESDDAALRRSLERLGADPSQALALRGGAAVVVEILSRSGERFDLILADPPYVAGAPTLLPGGLAGLLSPGGLLVVQADRGGHVPPAEGLHLIERRGYGRNVFHLFGMH